MSDQAKLEELKRLAMAATPGNWHWDGSYLRGEKSEFILEPEASRHGDASIEGSDANKAYIASSNPATMLELIAEIERLKERVDDLSNMNIELGEQLDERY